jgi:Fur family ferric uptake transcriptional regulator
MDFKNILRARDLKVTAKRLEVLQAIENYGSAMPYSELQRSLSGFDRVTLYRNINTLMDKGVIHKASTRGAETYYAICSHHCTSEGHNHQHIHFKCTSCKEVSCLQIGQNLTIQIPNVQVQNIEIEASGICQNCQ